VPSVDHCRVPLFRRNVSSDSIVAPLTVTAPAASRIGFAVSESRMACTFAARSAVVGAGLPAANAHWAGVAAHHPRKRYMASSVDLY
jgi:hypothetical protein